MNHEALNGQPATASLRRRLYRIAEDIGPRPIGSPGNTAAREYIIGELERLGLPPSCQQFKVEIAMPGRGHVRLLGSSRRLECWPCLGSPSLSPTALQVVHVPEGFSAAVSAAAFTGRLVVSKRGELHESVKAEMAAAAGARAVLFYVDDGDLLYAARVSTPVAAIPAGTVRKSFVLSVIEQDVPACEVAVESTVVLAACTNLWVDLGPEDRNRALLCAHFDSRPFTNGANDNASGVACLLEIIQELAKQPLQDSYRCVFFDAEEVGVKGSQHYVEVCGVDNIKFVANIDGLGFGRPAVLVRDRIGVLSPRLAEKAREVARMRGMILKTVESKTGLSDHGPFRDRGLECLWISDHPNHGRETDADNAGAISVEHLAQVTRFFLDFLRQ